ncbi:GTP-binding protein 1-like isoform X2 [Clavelina lepadiformis]|uniref:GTP-binding protein 1-like isoform X2 n=1 Tax=Clavelina lepadiformis TaxID=159417 RepID=UPI0040435F71
MEKSTNPEQNHLDNLFAPSPGEMNHEDNDIEERQIFSKVILISPTDDEYHLLMKQLKQRIQENQGECVYAVGESDVDVESGLCDEELAASKATLLSLAESLDCHCTLLRERPADKGKIAEFLIRRRYEENDFLEVKVAVVGNVDAGKSTLLGVLTHCELDNGRGYSRQKLFRHKHEVESGRTSSIGNEILGFRSDGCVVNKPSLHGAHIDWNTICQQSSKVITFVDLAGHEKYLKTTVFGMTGHLPDFCMLMVGSNAGIVGTTKEHLGLALALNVPVFVVVTKIDMCPSNILQGVGTVVSGTVMKGSIKAGENLMLGPDLLGSFELVQIKSIHRKRMAVHDVRAGQTAAFALKKVKRANIRKGMVMVSPKYNPKAVWEYKGEVLVLHHPTTISTKYQAMVHCGSIRQTASILSMTKEHLRTGDKAVVRFRFLKNPEYLRQGTKFVFREGRTKAVGTITELIEDAPAYQSHLKHSHTAKNRQQSSKYTTQQSSSGSRRGGKRWTQRNNYEVNEKETHQQ